MHEINPYAPSLVEQPEPPAKLCRRRMASLIFAYLGTTCAGGVFGLIGGPIGVIIGVILAGVVGALVFAITAALARLSGTDVNRTWLGTVAGALTGFISLSMFFVTSLASMDVDQALYGFAFALVPASLGGLGGFLGMLMAGASPRHRYTMAKRS